MEVHMDNSTNELFLHNLLKRGQFSLEDYDYKTAHQLFDQALNVNTESGAAYIGLAKAKARITRDEEFFEYCVEQYGKVNATLQRARQFADDDWKDFFSRVDAEAQNREKEKALKVNKAMKVTGLIAIGVALIIAVILSVPHLVFFSAEQLYKSGQYEQAYKRAVQISSSGLGAAVSEGRIEKYAYAYLTDYIKRNGELKTQLSDNLIVRVFLYGDGVSFMSTTDTNQYNLMWMTEAIYYDSDSISCSFIESEYTSSFKKSVYVAHGEFIRADYWGGKSIESSINFGSPRFSTRSALYENAEITISEALSLIQKELGIQARYLGFYSCRQ